MTRRFWTAEEIELLHILYPELRTEIVAWELKRTVQATYGMAQILGISKSAAFLHSAEGPGLKPGSQIGAPYRFRPGHTPANKGIRRPGWAPGRMASTQFKQGDRSHTWKPVGTILADGEGYRRIKVRERRKGDGSGWDSKVWPLLEHHVWKQHGRRIPKGKVLAFKDGNRARCEIENLECITRRELMARNAIHNLPQDLRQVILLNGALKRKIGRLTNGKEQDIGPAGPSIRSDGKTQRQHSASGR